MFYKEFADCYETVIAALASQINMLEGEISYMDQRIDKLEAENIALNRENRKLKAAEPDGAHLAAVADAAAAGLDEISDAEIFGEVSASV